MDRGRWSVALSTLGFTCLGALSCVQSSGTSTLLADAGTEAAPAANRDDGGGQVAADASTDGSVPSCGICSSGTACDVLSGRCVPCQGASCSQEGGTTTDSGPSNEAGSTVAECTNSLGCVGKGKSVICDSLAGRCVECLAAADCPSNHDCSNRSCVPYTSCTNSLNCQSGQVCDKARSRCVDCVSSSDCAEDSTCVGSTCRKTCTSDKQCTPFQMLCALDTQTCAACLTDRDCPTDQFCSAGTCVADICSAGLSSCKDNSVYTCNAAGSSLSQTQVCSAPSVCVAAGGTASCVAQVCSPSVVECDSTGTKVVKCSADGRAQAVQQDCAGAGQICVAGACKAQDCTPNALFCSGMQGRRCAADGRSSSLELTCSAGKFCDDSTSSVTCKDQVCSPGLPVCSGNSATTCNATGSAAVSGGTDCGTQICVAGQCRAVIFRETFEGDLGAWTLVSTANYASHAISSSTSANGSGHSLQLTKLSSSIYLYYDGYHHDFAAAVQPAFIRLWMQTDTSSEPHAAFSATASIPSSDTRSTYSVFDVNLYAPSGSTGFLYVNGQAVVAPYQSGSKSVSPDTWHRIELRNINWTVRTFDIYLDGSQVSTAVSMAALPDGGVNGISRIDLFNLTGTGTVSFDEIDLL